MRGARPSPPGPAPTRCQLEPSPPLTPQIAVLVGAGDIADCGAADRGANAEVTAKLLDRIAGTVFTTGDNVVFQRHGRRLPELLRAAVGAPSRTHTARAPGNHEYQSPGALPYFDYFGDNAGPRGAGFYSYNLGNWHIISLNSEVGVSQGQEQYVWLSSDLEANGLAEAATRTRCTLAYWHHPLFTSGPSGGTASRMRDMWSLLHEFGVDVRDHRRTTISTSGRAAGRARPPRCVRHSAIHRRHRRRGAVRCSAAADAEQPVPPEGLWRARC